MDKKEVAAFFDSVSHYWDADMIKSQWKIDKILDVAEVSADKTVLEIIMQTLIQGYKKLKGTPLQGMLAFAG